MRRRCRFAQAGANLHAMLPDLLFQDLDLLVQRGDHGDEGPDRGGVGKREGLGLGEPVAAQRRQDRRGPLGDGAPPGQFQRGGHLRAGQLPAAAGPVPCPAVPGCRGRPGG